MDKIKEKVKETDIETFHCTECNNELFYIEIVKGTLCCVRFRCSECGSPEERLI